MAVGQTICSPEKDGSFPEKGMNKTEIGAVS